MLDEVDSCAGRKQLAQYFFQHHSACDINGVVLPIETQMIFSCQGMHLTVWVCEPQAETNNDSTVSSKGHDLLGEQNFPVVEKPTREAHDQFLFTGKKAATELGIVIAKVSAESPNIGSQWK
jgi:hypothetical protein